MASRAQSAPKTTAMTAPATAAGQLTTRPARRQAMPTAKPTGQMVGVGVCAFSSPCGSSYALLSARPRRVYETD
jgi:hypothetical protein